MHRAIDRILAALGSAYCVIAYFVVFVFISGEHPNSGTLLTIWLIPGLLFATLLAIDHYWLHPRGH